MVNDTERIYGRLDCAFHNAGNGRAASVYRSTV